MACINAKATTSAIQQLWNLFNQSYGVHITPHHTTISLGGTHTHTHTHTHTYMQTHTRKHTHTLTDIRTEKKLKNQVRIGLRGMGLV